MNVSIAATFLILIICTLVRPTYQCIRQHHDDRAVFKYVEAGAVAVGDRMERSSWGSLVKAAKDAFCGDAHKTKVLKIMEEYKNDRKKESDVFATLCLFIIGVLCSICKKMNVTFEIWIFFIHLLEILSYLTATIIMTSLFYNTVLSMLKEIESHKNNYPNNRY